MQIPSVSWRSRQVYIDRGLLSCICMNAVCNVRPHTKFPVSLFCPPCHFPFEESKYTLHLLLNKLNFLIPSICMGLGFHPLISETYTNKDQQNGKTLVHIVYSQSLSSSSLKGPCNSASNEMCSGTYRHHIQETSQQPFDLLSRWPGARMSSSLSSYRCVCHSSMGSKTSRALWATL